MKRLILILVLPLVLFGQKLGDSLVVYWNFNNSSLLDTVAYDRYNAIYDFDKYGNYYHQLGIVDSCWLFNFGNFRQKKVSISGDSTVSINFWSKKNAYYQYCSRMSFGVGKFDMRDSQDSIIYVYDGDLFSSSKALIEDNRLRADSGWVMITITTDGDSVRSYVNGELNKTIKQDGVISPTTNPAPEIIFGGGTYTTRQWSGYIDEFGVWGRTLSNIQIASLFNDTLVFPFDTTGPCSPTDSLIHQWSFNVDASDTVGSLDGTLEGSSNAPVKAFGINDSCYLFNTNGYIDVGTVCLNKHEFSFGVWFKSSTDNDCQFIYSSYPNPSISINSTNIYFYYPISGSGQSVVATGISDLADGNWHFLVGVFNNGVGNIYYDGQLKNSETETVDSISVSSVDIDFCTGGTFARRYSGYVDEPFIFNRALDSCEVSAMWNDGTGLFYDYDGVCSCFGGLLEPDTCDTLYFKELTIDGSTGAGTDYQIALYIGESSGATDEYFDLEGNSNYFPTGENESGDLMFSISSDLSDTLDFWIEKVTGTTPNRLAYTWVKVPSNLDTEQKIYCFYHGDSLNLSNGDSTFIFFDDFSSGNLDKWDGTSYGTTVVENGRAKMTTSAGIYHNLSEIDSITYQAVINNTTDGNDARRLRVEDSTSMKMNDFWVKYDQNLGTLIKTGGVSNGTFGLTLYSNIDYVLSMSKSDAYYNAHSDYIFKDSISTWETLNINKISLHSESSNTCYWDNVIIRKFVKPIEPLFSSAGFEDTLFTCDTIPDTFLIDWNGIDLDLIDTWNGIDLDLIQSINGINLK